MYSFRGTLLLLCALLPSAFSQDSKPGAPVHDGQPKNCDAWYTVQKGDDCESVPKKYGVSKKQFLAWNPAVSQDCLTNFWLGYAYCVGIGESKTVESSGTSTIVSSEPTTTDKSVSTESLTKPSTTTSAPGQDTSNTLSATISSITAPYSIRHPVFTWNITTPTTDMSWPPKATQAGQPKDCNKWHLVEGSHDCETVLNKHSREMSQEDFFSWNPEVHQDCSGLFVGYWVCVGVKSTKTTQLEWLTSTPPFTPPPDATPHTVIILSPADSDFTPTPTQGPLPTNCQNFHKVEANENCQSVLKTFNYLSKEQFFNYNPVLNKNCDGLWKDHWYCVGVADELPAPPTVTTTPSSIPSGSPKDCKS
ncbi:hypothetical protein FGRMN_10910, partial [Fusarium graminum]